jgi:hypothetical protein
MLSFSKTEFGLQVYCDDAGIALLQSILGKLVGSGSHVHLKAPSCGGHELSDETPWGEATIGEVVITHGGD